MRPSYPTSASAPPARPGRRLRTTLSIVAATVLAVGASLTMSHVAQADTLFSANFEDGSLGSWSKSGGAWSVATDGSRVAQQSNAASENARIFGGDSTWTDYSVSARIKPLSFGSGGHAALLARATGSTKFYRLALQTGNRVQLQAVNGSSITVLGSLNTTVSTGTWYTLAITVSGTTISGTVNGTSVGNVSNSLTGAGRIGLQTVYASANFDDVTVSTTGGGTPTSTTPTRSSTPTRSASPTPTNSPTRSPTPTPTGTVPAPNWPTPTGSVNVDGTIQVSGTFNGQMRRYCCMGDGSQDESQDPMFELADGATLQNVIIGSPAGDGVHCLGRCTIQNVWWEDVGEDAATFQGTNGDSYVYGGGARSASDKVFQHNGSGTVHISGFYGQDIGKLYRACGNCSSSYQRHVQVDNVLLDNAGYVVGINSNWGDTATLTQINLRDGEDTHICAKYEGVAKGSEPDYLGDGVNDANCRFTMSDIHYL